MKYKIKAQSMLEYLVVLTAVVIVLAIVSGNAGLLRGGLKRTYDDTERDFKGAMTKTTDGTHQESVVEYTPESLNITMRPASSYEGRQYFENKDLNNYYYHEGESDMSGVPQEGTVVETQINYDENRQAPLWPGDTGPTPGQMANPYPWVDTDWWIRHSP